MHIYLFYSPSFPFALPHYCAVGLGLRNKMARRLWIYFKYHSWLAHRMWYCFNFTKPVHKVHHSKQTWFRFSLFADFVLIAVRLPCYKPRNTVDIAHLQLRGKGIPAFECKLKYQQNISDLLQVPFPCYTGSSYALHLFQLSTYACHCSSFVYWHHLYTTIQKVICHILLIISSSMGWSCSFTGTKLKAACVTELLCYALLKQT